MPNPCKLVARSIAILFFCCWFVDATNASTFVMPSDDDMIIGARAIVRGKVLSISCREDAQTGRIFSYIRLRVREVIKGDVVENQIVLKQEGGQIGNRGSTVFGSPRFAKGEHVLVFLDTWRDGSLRVYQMFLGKFSITDDPGSGEEVVTRDAADRETSIVQMANASGKPTTSRMRLAEYVTMVKNRLAINAERSAAFARIYYRDTPILAKPAEYSRQEEAGFQAQFRLITSPPPRWFEPDEGLPVSFVVNPEGAPSSLILDDVSAAMNAWSSVSGCSLRLVNAGAAPVCYPRDTNSIIFNNCDGQFGATPGCASILALGGVNWDSSQTRVVHGTTFVRAADGHISFNPYANCDFDDHCIVREIATHEIGHAVGLGHSQFADATMAGSAHFDGRCASIRQDDIDAITFVYPLNFTGSSPLTIVSTSPFAVAIIGESFSRQLLATGGLTPYTWRIVSGSLPEGISMTTAGIVSGTPTTGGRADFTVEVTDPARTSVQKPLSMTVIAPPSGYDSQFVSQTVPAEVKPGQSFFITIKWLNTGTKPWDGIHGFAIRSQNPERNVVWGGDTVPWVSNPVNPGETMDLLFQATAPSAPGIYNFQWQLYQSTIAFFGEMSTNVSIPVSDGTPPSITASPTVTGVRGTFLTQIPSVNGGLPPYSWQIISGSLPAGTNLNPNTGAIVGTPSMAGNFAITLQVTDAKSQTAQTSIAINIAEPPLGITSLVMSPATRGVAFSQQLGATGGRPPYAWSVTNGTLPPGLSLVTSTGMISGTPTASGAFNFTITVTDAQPATNARSFLMTVAAPPLSTPTVPLLETMLRTSFSFQLNATGGTPPYSWSLTTGSLPAGLSLNSSGLISGSATAAGVFNCVASVRDQGSVGSNVSIQIKVIDPDTIPLIRKIKYKNHKKLIVTGDRIQPTAVLLVDGTATNAVSADGSFVIKLALSLGPHEIKIINPGPVPSQPSIFIVE